MLDSSEEDNRIDLEKKDSAETLPANYDEDVADTADEDDSGADSENAEITGSESDDTDAADSDNHDDSVYMADTTASSAKKHRMPRWLRYTVRVLITAAVTLALILCALLGVMFVLAKGPSPTAQRLFVLSVKETSAVGFLADIYLSHDEIDAITASDFSMERENAVNAGLININPESTDDTSSGTDTARTETASTDSGAASDTASPAESKTEDAAPAQQTSGIRIDDVTGATYKGKMMVVTDPSRVTVGIPNEFGEGKNGLTVMEMIDKYGCTGGINAGGFYDPNGSGTGGIPDGLVIYDGELRWGEPYKSYSVIGFDKSRVLYVGTMTGSDALSRGIEQAVSFGPALIINGAPCNQNRPLGGGINPRTAIGQCADGTILMLVINGRQIDSLGATFDDVVDIMLSYGAVNASNLDGGSSSIMVYNKEYLTSSAYLFGERKIASSILVK